MRAKTAITVHSGSSKWSLINGSIDRLLNGGSRWAQTQIAEDHARTATRRTGRRSRRANIAPDEDVSAVLGTEGQAPDNLDSGLTSPPSPSANDVKLPPLQEDEDMDDSDPQPLNTYGDIASTITLS